MVKPVRTWIVVADAARARIVLNEGVGHGVVDVEGGNFQQEVLRDSEVYADKPGRGHERMTAARHGMARTTDVKDQASVAFAREIVDYLKTQAHKGAFDRLVLIADPGFLGHLRAALPKQVAAVVHAEIPKDLTREKNEGLLRHLEDVLAV